MAVAVTVAVAAEETVTVSVDTRLRRARFSGKDSVARRDSGRGSTFQELMCSLSRHSEQASDVTKA